MRIDSLQLAGVGPFDDTTLKFPPGKRDDLADVYLLVGENGSGKTTALHVLASLLAPQGNLGHLRPQDRFRKEGAFAQASAGQVLWSATKEFSPILSLPDVTFRKPSPSIDREFGEWNTWSGAVNGMGNRPLSWAAFAYAGERQIENASVTAIQEPSTIPLQGCMAFGSTADTHALMQWVANQDFKRLKAQDAGQKDKAAAIAASISTIEAAISDAIDGAFHFKIDVDTIDVRAELNGTRLDFAMLPSGVKSITSWIADLLMRLDRIPWVDGLQPTQRSFLLLLDEIDIHLHPSWQRRLLPVVQKIFPKAQIIASTHSPFVVASLADGAVIELKVKDGKSTASDPVEAPVALSYSATLRSLFGIDSDFDLKTEELFKEFQALRTRVLGGDPNADRELREKADELRSHGEEVGQLVEFELRQMRRASDATASK